ncbi:MAG: hypothetical protein ACYDBQ_03875 [Thermoplasmatota archaeon]
MPTTAPGGERGHAGRRARLGGWAAWWPAAAAGLVLAVAFALLVPYVFPSGGDPGHMIAVGRGTVSRESYAPLVPLLLALVAAGGPFALTSFLVKLFAIASLAFAAAGTAYLTRCLTDHPIAPRWAFLVAALNPMALYEVLWGGLAQFWGMGFALFAVAHALQWRTGAVHRVAAAACAVATLYAHAYMATFLAAAGLTVLLFQRPWREDRQQAVLLAAGAAAACVPALVVQVHVAGELRRAVEPPALLSTSYMPGVLKLLEARSAVAAAALVVLLLAAAALARGLPAGVRRERLFAWSAGFGAGFLLLLLVTPASLAGRAFYILPALFIPWTSIALTKPRRALQAATWVAVALLAGSSLQAYAADRSFFDPMGADSLAAFQALGKEHPQAVAVYSPFANVDGWWMEAVTRAPSVPTDLARLYTLSPEVEGMDSALVAAAGESALDLGAGVLAASPARLLPAPLTLLARQGGNPIPVLTVLEEASTVTLANGTRIPLRAPGAAGAPLFGANGAYRETWSSPDGVVRRSALVQGGALGITYVIPGAAHLHLVFGPGWEGAFEAGTPPTHVWDRDGSRTPLRLDPPPTLTGGLLGVEVPIVDGTAAVTIRLPLPLTPATHVASAVETLARVHASALYIRALVPPVRERFDRDPAFTPLYRGGDVEAFGVVP